ncbi:hypothetical protein SAMN05444422_10522 [Halobiforma haloterrestris]|uniref:Uncharacterized protein n=1 Tax=Natronobacterium haloterrestre TaxID=148448 RepID=A0A1I1GTM4_NATHA|nr:hypothetical protein [Halobiforma haloterrestris]SFC15014.1 hypothetical protein SAMN05444422_10522 [Halobiforma haloterrestris]
MRSRPTLTTTTPGADARAVILVAIVAVSAVAAAPLFAGTAAADEPETADDYFEEFRAMEGTEAYEEYDEFETIRTFAVTQVQETGTLDDDERAQLEAARAAMVAFDQAYRHAENGDYEESLEYAEETDAHIAELEEYEQTQATLADLAVTRFYEGLADGLYDEAEAAERTPDRLELLSLTATAYERANMPDEAAEFNLQVQQETAAYEAALAEMDDAEADAEAFFDDCEDCNDVGSAVAGAPNVLGTFEQYQEVRTVDDAVADARAEATFHGLEDREEALATLDDETSDARLSLAIASASVLVGYGVIVGLFGTVLLGRIFAWQRTYERAQVGSVVTVGDGDV